MCVLATAWKTASCRLKSASISGRRGEKYTKPIRRRTQPTFTQTRPSRTQENDHDDHDMDGGGGQGARGGIPFHMAHVPYHPPVDLEERDPEGATPLHVAMSYKRLEAARMLLEAGAGTSKRLEGSTPAHIALAVSSVRKHRDFADA